MERLFCPYCNSGIDEYTSTCPKCNSKIKTICHNCKKIINTNWRECPNCGQAIIGQSVAHAKPSDMPVETKTQIYSDSMPVETKTQIYSDGSHPINPQNTGFTGGNVPPVAINYGAGKKPYSKKFLASLFAVLLLLSAVVVALALMYNLDRYYEEGVSYYNEKKYSEAISSFEKVLMINPGNSKAKEYLAYSWYGRGIEFNGERRYPEAIVCYEKAISIDPNYLSAWNDKGVALKNQGKYAEALECYDRAIEINPNYKQAWNNKGIVFFNLGNYSEAIVCYDRAIAIDPNYSEAIRNRENAILRL